MKRDEEITVRVRYEKCPTCAGGSVVEGRKCITCNGFGALLIPVEVKAKVA